MTDVAYVTRHTYKKLAGTWIQPVNDVPMDSVFSSLFRQSLEPILNEKEAIKLYSLKQMLSGAISSLRPVKKNFSHKYVFKINPPRYHSNPHCDLLKSDFKNHLVPAAIEALGPEKVAEFQEYCEKIKKDYEDKPEDVFWAQVGAKFRVHISPQSVEYENSGVQDVKKMTVSELKDHIDHSFSQCLAMLESENCGRTLKQFRYAPHVERALGKVNDADLEQSVKEFFNLKWKVIDLLFELYRKEADENGYVLPVDLMASMGLEPCKGCSKQLAAAT